MDWLQQIQKEWPMIKAAPFSFAIACAVTAVVIWLVMNWAYGRRLEQKDELINGFKEKLGLPPSSSAPLAKSVEGVALKRFTGPARNRVDGRTFINQQVQLDDFSYVRCTFKNVTFVYNGTAAFDLTNNRIEGGIQIQTDRAGIFAFAVLLKALGMMKPEVPITTGPDRKPLDLR